MSLGGSTFIIVSVLVFVAVLLALEGGYLVWRSSKGKEAKKLHKRLQMLAASRDTSAESKLLKQRMLDELPALEKLALSIPRVRSLDRLLVQSGLGWTLSKLLTLSATCAVGVWIAVALLVHQGLLIGLGLAFAGALGPLLFVSYHRGKRLQKIEHQLPDALDLIGRGLRAGHAFSSTLKMAGEELPEPIGSEFRTAHDEINFGVSLQQALSNLCDRVPSTDVRYFVVAVIIQRESGGNLTEILTNLSQLIRQRLKLLARVRVLSTEGRMSAWILSLMPFALAALMNIFNPKFMSVLWTDPIGISILKVMLTMMAIGAFILSRIIKIRV